MRCGNLRMGYCSRDYQLHWRTDGGAGLGLGNVEAEVLVSCLVYDWHDARWYWLDECKPALRAEAYTELCARVSLGLAHQFAHDLEAGRTLAELGEVDYAVLH